MESAPEGREEPQLPRVLGPAQAFAVVVGGVVGASIFLVPSLVARQIPFLSGILLVWVLGAAVSLAGVLTLSELAAMLPQAGGGYVFIKAALGPGVAFLFAWMDTLLIRSGAAATISFTFSIYFSQFAPAPAHLSLAAWRGMVSIGLVLGLAGLNILGSREAGNFQVAGTVLKMAALASAIVLPALLWRGPDGLRSMPLWPATAASAGFAVTALIPVLWTYGGWDQAAYLAEEIRDPGRNLPRVLTFGMLTVAGLYMAVVIGIHLVLPVSAVAASGAVGADLFHILLGNAGTVLISIAILISTLFSANAAIMSGPRSCFAVGRDGYAPAWIGKVDPRFKTPAHALLLVGGWTAALIAMSVALMVFPPPARLPGVVRSLWAGLQQRPLFEVLISYVMFGYLGMQGLVTVSALVLRRTHPEWPRPYRTPGYPWTPLASLAATVFLMAALAWSSPIEALAGTGIVLSGVPMWMWMRARSQKPRAAARTDGQAVDSGSISSR